MTSSFSEERIPTLLVCLTVLTGIVDAVSYLQLGRVFVANMTGNIVFLGFALAGARGIDPVASTVALLAFVLGARVATLTLTIARADGNRTRMIALVTTLKTALLLVGVVLALGLPVGEAAPARYALTFVLAVAMGAQSAVAKKLAVADLSTTVVTMTLTSLGAGGQGGRRRLIAIAAMGGGAFFGAAIVLHSGGGPRLGAAIALGVAVLLGAGVAVASWRVHSDRTE